MHFQLGLKIMRIYFIGAIMPFPLVLYTIGTINYVFFMGLYLKIEQNLD